MIEIPHEFIGISLKIFLTILVTFLTGLGVYYALIKEVNGAIGALSLSVIFWLFILTIWEIIIWV